MITINTKIKGLTPLIMDALRVDTIINPPSGVRKYTDDVMAKMAEKSLYRNDAGEIFIPNRNIKRCLIDGAKMGRVKLNARQNLYPFIDASVFISPLEILLGKKEPDAFLQIPMRRKDGNVIPKRLPIFKDWELTFTLSIYDDEIPDKVKQSLEVAGISVGLGNQRPEYGRFECTEWEVKK